MRTFSGSTVDLGAKGCSRAPQSIRMQDALEDSFLVLRNIAEKLKQRLWCQTY
jgi:hypothetical protein